MTPDQERHDDQWHDLAAAYALDALPSDEVASFEGHLATCPSCTEEVASLRTVAGHFADLSTATPPDDLRTSVLDAVTHIDQVDPAMRGSTLPDRERSRERSSSPATTDDQAGVVDLSEHRRLRATARIVTGVAAALALIAGALGLWAIDLQEQLHARDLAADQIAAVLSAPDAQLTEVDGSSLVRSPSRERAVFTAGSVPAPGEGRVLQLWVIDDQGPTSAGLVEDPSTPTLLDIPVPEGAVVGVTVEPAGGSDQPTSDPIVAFQT